MSDTSYRLDITGGPGIEDETRTFDHLSNAVHVAERRSTDEHDGWEFADGSLKLVDQNRGQPVDHTITRDD